MFRLPKRDDKKSLFEPVESLTQKPRECNLLSNFLPQIVEEGDVGSKTTYFLKAKR